MTSEVQSSTDAVKERMKAGAALLQDQGSEGLKYMKEHGGENLDFAKAQGAAGLEYAQRATQKEGFVPGFLAGAAFVSLMCCIAGRR
eukprot:CAMPEP_0172680692 /NCGR_PEP_ID=MMETSP1074-20121228/16938_1 /TAXON_ID=2916 /ORGANISM="Ceratium fusus, Strain PA161109" /LENGTH=86 /DNA_ID=CAMNT_0013499061 /DNA_START=63 /DNA_END=323 /DNA_ORIENTATION=-